MSYFMVPYSIAFQLPDDSNSQWAQIEIFLNIMILCDICLKFFTARDRDRGVKPKHCKLAIDYLSKEFFFDVISCLPDLIRTIVNGSPDKGNVLWYWLKLLRFRNLNRSLSLVEKLIMIIFQKYPKHVVCNIRNFTVKIVFYFLLFHCLASLWIVLG